MRLDLLLDAVEVLDLEGDPATDVVDVTYSTDAIRDGALFCCLRGRHRDGHDFAPDAVRRGASALLVERYVDVPGGVAQARVRDARHAMGLAAAALHDHPSRKLTVVGVTGTNGKSTTCHLVQTILDAAGRRCGVVGTMNASRTTPEAPDLQAALAGFLRDGYDAAAIEVSSVGLAQQRVVGTEFAAAIFTNLSPDELWIHGTVEEYFRAKARLFEPALAAVAVVNADDEWGRRLIDEHGPRLPVRAYRMADAADLDVTVGQSTFVWRGVPVTLPLEGAFNVANALAALTATAELGVAPEVAAAALAVMPGLEGHGEAIDEGQPFRVVVDYAHTGRALEAVLQVARESAGPGGRVFAVFGCGGDRDPSRRAAMGEAAGRNADVVIVTSDNPRSEDPMAIIDAIVEAARAASPRDLRAIEDRRAAIHTAIAEAREGDVVVIAGKGPETGQIVGDVVLPFDDAVVAREAIAARGTS